MMRPATLVASFQVNSFDGFQQDKFERDRLLTAAFICQLASIRIQDGQQSRHLTASVMNAFATHRVPSSRLNTHNREAMTISSVTWLADAVSSSPGSSLWTGW